MLRQELRHDDSVIECRNRDDPYGHGVFTAQRIISWTLTLSNPSNVTKRQGLGGSVDDAKFSKRGGGMFSVMRRRDLCD
jgi:hypothetical protein